MTRRFHFYMLVCGLVGLGMASSLAVASHVPGCTVTVTAQDTNGLEKVFEGCTQSFADNFEAGLVFQENGWHKYQYMGLSSNKVAVVSEKPHLEAASLKSTTGSSLIQQKAALARQLLWFHAGSHFWMSVWVYIVGGTRTSDFYFFDLESTQVDGNPGRRLMLGGPNGDWLSVNAKHAGANAEQSLIPPPLAFPKNKWVQVKMHLYLSPNSDGLTEVWQDGVKIITKAGETIPSGLVYDWIELGTTANLSGQAQVVYLDDLVISKDPIP